MNFTYIRYAVAIERYGSISLAAKELKVAQPNLSNALKELEKKLGIKIFKRTATGMIPTIEGIDFLESAKDIVRKFDNLENDYNFNKNKEKDLMISSERATYSAAAFCQAINEYEGDVPVKVHFRETSTMKVLDDVIKDNASLGIVRCQKDRIDILKKLLKDEGIEYDVIWEFDVKIIAPKTSILSNYDVVGVNELAQSTEIIAEEYLVPNCDFLPPFIGSMYREDDEELTKKRMYFNDRGTKTNLLYGLKEAYAFITPLKKAQLDQYGLDYVNTSFTVPKHMDLIIYKNKDKITGLEKLFIRKLYELTSNELYN